MHHCPIPRFLGEPLVQNRIHPMVSGPFHSMSPKPLRDAPYPRFGLQGKHQAGDEHFRPMLYLGRTRKH